MCACTPTLAIPAHATLNTTRSIMALPANIGFCTVIGRFIRATADGVDGDRDPDGIPVSGMTITFTAPIRVARNVTTVPPVTVFIDPIVAATDATGVLVGSDLSPGILLVASDDADLSPSGWSYSVTIAAPSIPAFTFDFNAPAGTVVDLSTVIPVPASPGAEVAAWQAAVAATLANAAVASAAAATVTSWAEPVGLSTATKASLSATYARLSATVDGPTLIGLGDSIIGSGGSTDPSAGVYGDNFTTYAMLSLNAKLRLIGNAGVPGETSAQILARVPAVVAVAPSVCLVLAGTNDVGAVPLATSIANLTAIYAGLRAAGITAVACTLPPRTDARTAVAKLNHWIKRYCALQGIPIVDLHGALVDVTTGGYSAGLSSDGIHPIAKGARVMGDAVAAALLPIVPNFPPLLAEDNGTTGAAELLYTNPLMLIDSNADGVPDGWSSYAGTGYTHSTPTVAGVLGKTFRTVRTATDSHVNDMGFGSPASYAIGDRISLSGIVSLDGETSGMLARIRLNAQGAASAPSQQALTITGTVVQKTFSFEYVVPPGTTALVLELFTNGGLGTFDVAQVTLVNLTKQGLA
jgi:lysophospholipase L1-like esterase